MQYYNLKHPQQSLSFADAVRQGLGQDQGLFFPKDLPRYDNIDELLAMPLAERSAKILYPFVADEFSEDAFLQLINDAFNFPANVQAIDEKMATLELFHGPTLAFKDFGARFMAHCLQSFSQQSSKPITILTATSGDTGAAVAHAFYGLTNIKVVILYPKGKISLLQEKMFTTLGGNIETIAIDGSFDDCQALVKQSFDDEHLKHSIGLNSANSINISRLLAQICYYFEAAAQLKRQRGSIDDVVVSVPSGNFGNLTAAMLAKAMGLPIKRFVAATNVNDTVPRYLKNKMWLPNDTISTMSNAMDVSKPNNWPRVEHMLTSGIIDDQDLAGIAIDEEQTQIGVTQLNQLGYISEPHAAVAYKALKYQLKDDEFGLFLGTAHPAKFKDTVESILGTPIALPKELADCSTEEILSVSMANDFAKLRDFLLG
ncbi:threonine synthase [Thalassotalea sp. HSM 43]|uniref:threonine synthase n=1 Tax=Thalassotalea sp. HSM 43 TaxID=2552945 RepID=UPI001080E2C0|nr:threonine synthase [Thalassotalea sp. HSM 43]QBY03790.1 threonine synthase [Thalassotalea sp. HSM 43]